MTVRLIYNIFRLYLEGFKRKNGFKNIGLKRRPCSLRKCLLVVRGRSLRPIGAPVPDFYVSWFKDGRQLRVVRTGRGVRVRSRTLFVSSRSGELAWTRIQGGRAVLDEIATASGEGKTVGFGEMGRSRSRSKSPSRRRHKSKHSRKRSKSREKHSNNKYSDKPKERSSKSRWVPRSRRAFRASLHAVRRKFSCCGHLVAPRAFTLCS